MRRPSLLAALSLVAGLAACEHAQPFGTPDPRANGPFSSAFPRQLTFRAGPDLDPAWLPDGSGIIYSFARDARADGDRCLGVLPAEGGYAVQTVCHVPAARDADSTNVLSHPAVGAGGRLAYLREASPVGAVLPSSSELVVATLSAADPGRVVLTLPYTATDGRIVNGLSHLHWVDAGTLVFVAELRTYPGPPAPADTVVTPIEVMRLTLAADSSAAFVVPGTVGATSVSPSPTDSGTVYITILGDSVVYGLELASGLKSPLYVLAGAGPASDAQVAGTHLAVIAAGLTRQTGLAGQLYDVDLVAGTARQLTARMDLWYQRPALSPSGARLVAEGHAIIYARPSGVFGPVDTLVSKDSDLWLLPTP
jgi:hypothetical protein